MGRTKLQPGELAEDVQLADGLSDAHNQMALRQQEVMQRFGDSLPYERSRIVHETRFYMAQSAEAMLEAGKRLVILKENEPHGEFIEIIESQLSLSRRTAQVMMQASLKYLSPKLESKAQTFALLGKSKLFELMTEDDENLAELADGGTVAGLKLDDVDRMSCRELRQALREARETSTAQQQVLASKNEKIDELATKLEKKSRIQPPPPDEEGATLETEIAGYKSGALSTLSWIASGFAVLTEHTERTGIGHAGFMAGLLDDLQARLLDIREQFDLPEFRNAEETPDWLREEDAGHE